VEQGTRKRKWGLVDDTEDDSDNSSEEYVEIVPKPSKRSTPRRKAAVLTWRMKRMKVVERDGDSLRFVSPVPPVKRGRVWSKGDCQEGKQMMLKEVNAVS
jgi:hypothetical protein